MPPFRMIESFALSLAVVSVLAAACAKRPATATTTAPAPTGQAVTTPQPGGPRAGAPPGTAGPPGPGDVEGRAKTPVKIGQRGVDIVLDKVY